MKGLWLKSGAVATIVALWSVGAMAQSTISASPALSGSSATTAKMVAPAKSAPLPLSITALEILYGPPVTSPGQHSSADDGIDTLQDLNLRSQVGPTWKFDSKTSLGMILDFNYIMANAASDPTKEGFNWNDSFLKLSRSGIVEQNVMGNKMALDADIRYYAPTAHSSIINNKAGALRATLMPSIQFGKSKWSISAVNFAKYQLQTRERDVDSGSPLTQLEMYAGPQLNYEFSDKLTAFVLYEADAKWNTLGQANYTNYAKSNTDIEPGVSLTLHERFTLIPVLNWYTNQRLDTTSLIVMASLKLL